MEHQEYVDHVRLTLRHDYGIRVDGEGAAAIISGVLEPLAAQMDGANRPVLAELLPEEVQDFWQITDEEPRLSLEAFIQDVSERQGVGVDTAASYVSAVMETTAELLSSQELERLRHALPQALRPLLERGAMGDLDAAL